MTNEPFPFQMMVYRYNEQSDRPLMKNHKHYTCELNYVTGGNAVVTVVDELRGTTREIQVFKNQLILIRPRVLHSINSNEGLSYYVLEISLTDPKQDPVKYLSALPYARQFKEWQVMENKWKDVLVVNDNHNLLHLLSGFRSLQDTPSPFKTAYLEIQLKRLFLAILQCEVPEWDTTGQNIHVRYAIQYILSNANKNISAKDVADNSKVSLAYMQRLFRETFDATITDKIRETKIKHAMQLLTTTNFTLNEVATSSGFHSMQNFESAFKRINNMSPRQYRQLYSRKIHHEEYVIDSDYSPQ